MYTYSHQKIKNVGSLVINLDEDSAKKLGFTKFELVTKNFLMFLRVNQVYKQIREITYKTISGQKFQWSK